MRLAERSSSALTWSAAGHAGVGSRWVLALLVDAVHLVSASAWLGGLALLVGVVLSHTSVDRATAGGVVRRFSSLALTCVVLIIVTGTYQTWRNTGSWGALFHTRYGLLVCAKVLILLLLVLLGLRARWVLGSTPFHRTERPDLDVACERVDGRREHGVRISVPVQHRLERRQKDHEDGHIVAPRDRPHVGEHGLVQQRADPCRGRCGGARRRPVLREREMRRCPTQVVRPLGNRLIR